MLSAKVFVTKPLGFLSTENDSSLGTGRQWQDARGGCAGAWSDNARESVLNRLWCDSESLKDDPPNIPTRLGEAEEQMLCLDGFVAQPPRLVMSKLKSLA